MFESMKKYMKVGLIHFMAYPFAMGGEGDVERTIRRILEDDYFDCIEVTHITAPTVRERIRELAAQSGIAMVYGAQPQLMRNQENVNSLDEALRTRAVERMKRCIEEAYALGCEGIAYLAGSYEEQTKEESYRQLLRSTRELCAHAKAHGGLAVHLEIFDYDIEKRSLIGPAALAARFAGEISAEFDNFGLMSDLSHIPQLHETIDESIDPIVPYLRHAHIGNCVLKAGAPAYGDQHPRFGFPSGENGVDELAAFLRKLIDVGYLTPEQPRIVSFEVKPWGGEDPEMVIANAKRYLNRAWALV